MKKLITAIILTTFVLTLFTGCSKKQSADNSLNYIKSKGQLVVGLDDSFPPMGFKDDKGQIAGFDIDLAKEAAKRMGVKAVFKPVDWDGVLMSLNNKDIDLIWNGLTITDERKQKIDFSKPYLNNSQVIVVNASSSYNSKNDFSNKTIGVQLGSSSEEALNKDSGFTKSLKEIRKYSNNTEALMDLSAGRIDAVVIDEVVARYYMQKKPDTYKILNDNFGKESYGVGIRKSDTSFKTELDKVLDDMKKDGTADKISEKWFGKSIIVK
ncbi:amino acid ABC transporter substrate-binding protein [Clostridium sp. JN-9]|uniref:amino acid ABC transporter substrate-binding protein n=1 Tax=Clostridium sp. JN-9 TaxID=2507159 RepID=UPI000FFE3155|nr:amino acid ABC transporter substrate-binding protein [Clostridium sp. JN-9]QAT39448.1 amino acid ABC transporter substrate-binding protein [Clostridium sp. JN-9]